MSGRGSRAFVFLSVLALVLTGVIIGARADVLNVAPANNIIIHYPSFPNEGGPYIVGATYDPGNERVVLVFSDSLVAGSTALSDFTSDSFDVSGGTLADNDNDNVLFINDITDADGFTDNGTERIRIKDIGILLSDDGSYSDDVSWVTVGRGPIPTRVVLDNYTDDLDITVDDPVLGPQLNTQMLTIFWNDSAELVGSANAAFGETPEFNNATVSVAGENTARWEVTWASGDSLLKMFGGITKLHIASGQVRYDAAAPNNIANDRLIKFSTQNRPPYLQAAYYFDNNTPINFTDDVIWAVFNEPIDPATLDGAFDASGNFDTDNAGTAPLFAPTGGTAEVAFPGNTTSAVKIFNFNAVAAVGTDDSLFVKSTNHLADYQGLTLPDTTDSEVHVHVGPGIIRAAYDNGQTPGTLESDVANDQLVVWISEPISNLANVDTTDFSGDGEWFFGENVQVLAENASGLGKITFTNFSGIVNPDLRPRAGCRILGVDDGTQITGATTGDPVSTAHLIPITDESRPASVLLTSVSQRDSWEQGGATDLDSLFVGWSESQTDDSDQYFLFITKTLPGDIDNDWMNANLSRAIPLGNLRQEISGDVHEVGILIQPDEGQPAVAQAITQTTDEVDFEEGDLAYVLVAAADWTGNVQYRDQQGTDALLFGVPFWVGPICPPQDFYYGAGDNANWDSDIIHVVGDSTAAGLVYSCFGDPLAVPCPSDSIIAYSPGPDGVNNTGDDVRIGAGPTNADGSFDAFTLTVTPDDMSMIYLAAKLDEDETPAALRLGIRFDQIYPVVDAEQIFDPWNPYRVYNASDYVNIRLLLDDRINGTGNTGRNDVAHVWADFSRVDSTAFLPTGFSTTPDSIVLWGLGRDRKDNDGDWWSQLLPGDDDDPVDVGIDGVAGTDDIGEDNDRPDAGDPYVDENGNGQYDDGETFLDLVNQTGQEGVYDPGEPFLDSLDPDENGWYEVRANTRTLWNTVKQGFPLVEGRVRSEARLDPFTLVTIYLLDNGINNVNLVDTSGEDLSLEHVRVLDGTEPTQRFLATIDFQEPSVSEFTEIENGNGNGNLVVPGNPTYNLGRFLDVTVSAPSDDDALYTLLQLNRGNGWETMSLDPTGDANSDGYPGGQDFDDDDDAAGAGADPDEDGVLNEDTDGIDLADDEVHDATETAAADAANPNGDGISCENDRIDNDNDAYFIFDPFSPGDPVDPTAGYGVITWWNIDENPNNGLDDDGDGTADEADEYAECDAANTNRYVATSDDDEDGIRDGEAVAVAIGGNSVMGNGTGGPVYVAAAVVLGTRTSNNTAAADSLGKFYANNCAYTEVVPVAYPVMTNSARRFIPNMWDTDLPLANRTDISTLNDFNWNTLNGSDIDLLQISELFGLAADGVTTYQLRGLVYDIPGNNNALWSEPITFTMDLTPPDVALDGCGTDEFDAGSDFEDVDPNTADIVEIYDAGKHPGTYTLELQDGGISADAVEVKFQERRKNPDGTWGAWTDIGSDLTAPFTMEWPNTGSMFTVNNYPADRSVDVEFRADAKDTFGNWTSDLGESALCVAAVTVIDGTNPSSWIRGIYTTMAADLWTPLPGVIEVPADSSINIWIRIEDNDRDGDGTLTTLLPDLSVDNGDPFTTMWAAGIDLMTGDANQDDDSDNSTDEDDDGDGVFTLGTDGAGADNIPGTDDDEWNGVGANEGLTDDYITNDIMYIVTEIRQVSPPGDWMIIETVHGDMGGGGAYMDFTIPVKVTLDTETIAATYGEGLYEVRAWACDIEGNCNTETAPIATISIRSNALRAYIQPELCPAVDREGEPIVNQIGLFAVHFIHDYEIDKVRFEYWKDLNANGCADDAGESWNVIDTDDGNAPTSGMWGVRGDAVLYRNNTDSGSRDPLEELGWNSFTPTNYKYWDTDANGIYNQRDAVVSSNDGVYNAANDTVRIGGADPIPEGVALSSFPADHFWAESYMDAGADANELEPSDYIFRENQITGDNDSLELWFALWDPTGLDDSYPYLVQAVATDQNNNEDVIDQTCYEPDLYNPLEIEQVTIDTAPPTTNIMSITAYWPGETPGTIESETTDLSSLKTPPFVPGKTKWVEISAETADPSIMKMLFEFSTDGGVSWPDLDTNNDLDWYVSLDGTPGYQKDGGPSSSEDDELFFDSNGDFLYDAGDYVLYAGRNGTVDTPIGSMLLPLAGEEGAAADAADTDGDGSIDEDLTAGTASPEDYSAPFSVTWDLTTINFTGDVNVLLRATPTEDACPGGERAGDADQVAVIFGENIEPLADVIRVETEDDAVVDVWHTEHDGDPYDVFGDDVDTLRVFVTAEDPSGVVNVRLYYRSDPECGNPGTPADWTYVEATGIDSVYPYQFNWPMDPLPDGAYQFYAQARDANGNKSVIPLFPYGFRKFAEFGDDVAVITTPSGPDGAAVGDEYTMFATVDPLLEPIVGVTFYFAPRILDEAVDPTALAPVPPYASEALSKTVVMQGSAGNAVVLTINGVVQEYGTDYEINGGNQIEFAVKPTGSDVILVSYNFGNYTAIAAGDEYAEYTVEWSAADGGVPDPAGLGWTGADAYDLIAIARFDIDGDGDRGSGPCDFVEPFAYEGTYLILEDQERPLVVLYGLTRDTQYAYPDFNRPGNPLFQSIAGNVENKMSGCESDLFVRAVDFQGVSPIDSVWAVITAEDLQSGAQLQESLVSFTEYVDLGEGNNWISIPVTMYEADYPEFLPEDIENVTLLIGGGAWPMTEIEPGIWQAVPLLAYADTPVQHSYWFEVDLVGDTQETIVDARNNGELEVPTGNQISLIVTPAAPFWYGQIGCIGGSLPDMVAALYPNAVHRCLVYAMDSEGNVGNNLNSDVPGGELGEGAPQGPIVFIHDPTGPEVQEITVFTSPTNMTDGTDILVIANDDPFEDLNVITIDRVLLQYQVNNLNPDDPNYQIIWLDGPTDTDQSDGWFFAGWKPAVAPEADGFDNDGDGYWDEEDENVHEFPIRVVVFDDAMNSGYSDAQGIEASVTIDNSEPSATITTPLDGTVFAYGDQIHIEATAVGDSYPFFPHDDVALVLFQYRDGRYAYIDEAGHANSTAGQYDHGVDEVFEDTNGDGFYNAGEPQAWAGWNGVWNAVDGATGTNWFDMDVTPVDGADDPWDTDADDDGVFEIDFNSNNFWGGKDTYVRIRGVARDFAGNWDTNGDGYAPPEVLIVLNDDTGPAAYITAIDTVPIDPVEEMGIQGTVNLTGTFTPNPGTAYVSVWGESVVAEEPFLIGIDNVLAGGNFTVAWDTDAVAQGPYTLYATGTDDDGNESDPANALVVHVNIDRDAPEVNYTAIGDDYDGFVATGLYENDGVADQSSEVITPDPDTGDAMFAVTTPDDDVVSIQLQWAHGEDPEGFWRNWNELVGGGAPGGMMDYEPNLDFADGDVVHHVWRFHQEDLATAVNNQSIASGLKRWRALATDQAGNTNMLAGNFPWITLDTNNPTLFDWNDTAVTNQIEVGTSVDFSITTQDPTTDVVSLRLEIENNTDAPGVWVPLTGDLSPEALQLDSPNAMWLSEFSWTAPDFVIHDTNYNFRVRTIDSANNMTYLNWPDGPLTVEDNAPPDMTKIIDVQGRVYYLNDTADGTALPASGYDPTCLTCNDDVWIDNDGNGTYNQGTDFAISEGAVGSGIASGQAGTAYGSTCDTYPREIDESFLNDGNVRNTVKVNGEVTVVGRTQGGDDGIGGDDAGIAFVEFFATPTDADGTPTGDPILIGKDEHRPGFPFYYWHVGWDTTLLDQMAERVFPDGYYVLSARAYDQEGNVEELPLEVTSAVILIDTEAPIATMLDPDTGEAPTAVLEVQRNSAFTLWAETDPTNEDDVVTFYLKRARDLNTAASYGAINNAWGVTPEDGNPDETRPYSFDLALGLVSDPTDTTNNVPLHVGEEYDFVASVDDEVCNTTDHITNRDADRHITVKIIDTIAPHLTITQAVRAGQCGDATIVNPTAFHARALTSMTATLLTGDLDLSYVEFVYRVKGSGDTPTLIDADLSSPDGFTWVLGNWDLQVLPDQTWIEVAALGVDDVGNVESFDAANKIEIFVDRTPPPFTLMHPSTESSLWCDYELDNNNGHRIFDLIAQVTDRGDGNGDGSWRQHDDVCDVIWEWKWSYEDSLTWRPCGVAADAELYDDALNTYSNTIDFDLMDLDSNECDPNADLDTLGELIDLRVTIVDDAGNTDVIWVFKNTLDTTPPDQVNITNIKLAVDDPTQDPIDYGQVTNVTRGVEVEIWGTASDDEPNIPNIPAGYETGISMFQFQVAEDFNSDGAADGGIWRDLGTIIFDPEDLGDPSAVTGSVLWNTTGLVVNGEYLLRLIATDECGNSTTSGSANVIILDEIPPTARIACFDADIDAHGEDPLTYVKIYALAESDDEIEQVLFQYDTIEGEDDTDHEWVNIGFADPLNPGQHPYTTEVLWMTMIETTAFPAGQDHFWMRALALDEAGNRLGDLDDDLVPTMEVVLERLDDPNDPTEWPWDGSVVFRTVRPAEEPKPVVDVSVQIESPTQAILTVKMADPTERPRVVVLGEENNNVAPTDYWWIYSAGVPSDPESGNFGLVRSLNDPTVWRGKISLNQPYFFEGDEAPPLITECLNFTICVTGLDASWYIDRTGAIIREYPVTTELGTNGTVATTGYEAYADSIGLYNMVEIVPGAWPDGDACLLVSETYAPQISSAQAVYLEPVDHTAYHMELTKTSSTSDFVAGYHPTVVIRYSDEDVEAALAASGDQVTEEMLTVRRWIPNPGVWDGGGITWIRVNTEANEISFNVDNLTNATECLSDTTKNCGNIFQVFAPKSSSPVFVYNFAPHSEYLSDWWTDADPQVNVYLNDIYGQGIDPNSVVVKIDGRDVMTFYDYANDGPQASWVWGIGLGQLFQANGDGTVWELNYNHSAWQRDWIHELVDDEGQPLPHTFTVEYGYLDGTDETVSVSTDFYVDLASPEIEFHGGWVDNPLLRNVHGYISGEDAMLTVRMTDTGSGIFVRPQRQEYVNDDDCDGVIETHELTGDPMYEEDWMEDACWLPIDWGIKYDLWLVHPEDDQADIDEYEERMVLHEGTADEILPYIQRLPMGETVPVDGLAGYNPATDQLIVPLPIMAGGEVKDGDILEVVVYSSKLVQGVDGQTDGAGTVCVIDSLVVDGDTMYFTLGCWIDPKSQERHVYQAGVMDQVRNWSSRYVEQRFVVDMLPPVCTFNLPGATVDKSGDMLIDVSLVDLGVGLDTGKTTLMVKGPDGESVEVKDLVISGDRITGKVEGPLATGDYMVKVDAMDRLDHVCTTTKSVRVEATKLALIEPHCYPNPYNPAGVEPMTIMVGLNKMTNVTLTAKVYDFAGEYVTTLMNNERPTNDNGVIFWDGTASDGTKLANGAYIVHVVATDGMRTEKANIKAVIWRE